MCIRPCTQHIYTHLHTWPGCIADCSNWLSESLVTNQQKVVRKGFCPTIVLHWNPPLSCDLHIPTCKAHEHALNMNVYAHGRSRVGEEITKMVDRSMDRWTADWQPQTCWSYFFLSTMWTCRSGWKPRISHGSICHWCVNWLMCDQLIKYLMLHHSQIPKSSISGIFPNKNHPAIGRGTPHDFLWKPRQSAALPVMPAPLGWNTVAVQPVEQLDGGLHEYGGIQSGWFRRENLTKMDDLEVPLFQETKSWKLGKIHHQSPPPSRPCFELSST